MNAWMLSAGVVLFLITYFSVDIAEYLPFNIDVAGNDITGWLVSSAINAGAWILIIGGIFGKSSGGSASSSLLSGLVSMGRRLQ